MGDIEENGAVIINFAEPTMPAQQSQYNEWRRGSTSPYESIRMWPFMVAKYQTWTSDVNYWIIRLRETGITTKLRAMELQYARYEQHQPLTRSQ